MTERIILGFAICIGMITLSGWSNSGAATGDDLNTAINVLRGDLDTRYQNEMNVFNSLLQRTRRIEKRMRIVPLKKYRIMVNGKEV